MQKLICIVFAMLVLFVCISLNVPVVQNKTNVDVSWPNCRLTAGEYSNGIVGVTGGLDFYPNPCLAKEVTWFQKYSLYMNTGYPGPNYRKNYQVSPLECAKSNIKCLAYNYGYNAALYAIKYADQQNAHSNVWWFDVETENSWTNKISVNQAALEGGVNAIRDKVFLPRIGFYSTSLQWLTITGSWKNKFPAWVATGSTSELVAKEFCGSASFTGGPILLTQYTVKLDQNIMCFTGI